MFIIKANSENSIVRLISLNVNLFQVVLDFLFHFILILQDVLKLIVLLNRLFRLQNLQQFVLFLYDALNLGRLKVFVYLSLCQMSSQLLSVVLVLLLVLFDFAVHAQVRVVVLLFVQLLRKEWKNIDVGSLFHLHNQIECSLKVKPFHLQFNWLNRYQQLSDSIVYCGKG